MKIKITEYQAKRLKLNENIDPVSIFENLCKIKTDKLNKMYVKVSNITVIDILTKEVDVVQISDWLTALENELYNKNSAAYKYIEQFPEDELSDFDVRIMNAQNKIDDKINSLYLIINALEKLSDLVDENDITKAYIDTKTIDISGMQNS